MEIFNFLHLTTRRLIAVVAVAILAGTATAFVLVDDANSYEAEVVVFLGQALPPDRSTFAVGPFAGDLEVLLSLGPIQDEVARASGIDAIAIDGLTTRQIASGTAISIRATAETPELAEIIASEAARVGLTTLLEQERNRAQRSLDSAELQLLETRADLEQFRGNNQTQDPSVEYRIAVDELTSLQVQLLNTGLTTDVRDALEERQTELTVEIDRLAPLQPPYNELDRAAVVTETAVNQAKQELSETESLLAGAASGDFEISTPADIASTRGTLLAGVVASMIVVVLLSIGLFTLLDGRKRERNPPEQIAIGPGHLRTDEMMSTIEQDEADTGVSGDRTESASTAGPQNVCVCGQVCRSAGGLSSHQRACKTYQESLAESPAGDSTDPADTGVSGDRTEPASTAAPQNVCVCGRICRSAGGLSSHQRACKTYQESLAESPAGDSTDPADTGVSVMSAVSADSSQRREIEASAPTPIWVLMPDSATSELWEDDRSRLLKQSLEDASLAQDGPLTIVNAGGDAYIQIGQAEQAIADGAAVIVLIDSESDAVSMINELAAEAGIRVVVESTRAQPLTDRTGVDTNGFDDVECDDDGDDKQPLVVARSSSLQSPIPDRTRVRPDRG